MTACMGRYDWSQTPWYHNGCNSQLLANRVPMVWGWRSGSDVPLHLPNDAHYVLGFNEPNFHPQVHLTLPRSCSRWLSLFLFFFFVVAYFVFVCLFVCCFCLFACLGVVFCFCLLAWVFFCCCFLLLAWVLFFVRCVCLLAWVFVVFVCLLACRFCL